MIKRVGAETVIVKFLGSNLDFNFLELENILS